MQGEDRARWPPPISLSLPPGAMFSFMFTKHPILNYRRRQAEFLEMHRNELLVRWRGRQIRQYVNISAIYLRFFNGLKKIAADCAPIEWPPQEPSTSAQHSSPDLVYVY
jgi:hypothetical protein